MVTLSSKGRIVITKEVRDEFGVWPEQESDVLTEGDHIILVPTKKRDVANPGCSSKNRTTTEGSRDEDEQV